MLYWQYRCTQQQKRIKEKSCYGDHFLVAADQTPARHHKKNHILQKQHLQDGNNAQASLSH
jgi:hypothetical protein